MPLREPVRPLREAKEAFVREYAREVLAAFNENQSAAARALGVHRNTLAKLLRGSPGLEATRLR